MGMDIKKLRVHIKLCKRNLKSDRIKCCATCPFEEEITQVFPELKKEFKQKRKDLSEKKEEDHPHYFNVS